MLDALLNVGDHRWNDLTQNAGDGLLGVGCVRSDLNDSAILPHELQHLRNHRGFVAPVAHVALNGHPNQTKMRPHVDRSDLYLVSFTSRQRSSFSLNTDL